MALNRRLRRRLDALSLAMMAVLLVAGCAQTSAQRHGPAMSLEPGASDEGGPTRLVSDATSTQVVAISPETRRSPLVGPMVFRGTGQVIGGAAAVTATVDVAPDGAITLNFVNSDIREVIDAILGETLKRSYVIDPKVQGTVTVRTSQPLSAADVIPVLEDILSMNGAALVQSGETYKIVPVEQATAAFHYEPGYGIHIIPLRFASATAIHSVLEPYVPPGRTMRIDAPRNILIFVGTGAEAKDLEDLVRVFDVDWMAGMSFAIYPLQTADAKTLSQELDHIFGQDFEGPLAGMVQFVPIERLNAILVITAQSVYLDKAAMWIERLDRGESGDEQSIYVYLVQNGRAKDLAGLLSDVFGAQVSQSATAPAAELAPGLQPTEIQGYPGGTSPSLMNPGGLNPSGSQHRLRSLRPSMSQKSSLPQLASLTGGPLPASTIAQQSPPTPAAPAPALPAVPTAPVAPTAPAAPAYSAVPPAPALPTESAIPLGPGAGMKVVADERNNALVVLATPRQYRMVQATLKRLDVTPLQVFIEATIAEVTLNDQLKYGLQWFFDFGKSSITLSQLASGLVNPLFPGFSYVFSSSDAKVVLSALTSVTDVRVVSSPQLMVLDNEQARLQVGDQVPILSQSALTEGGTTFNSVEYRDTGVILELIPHVNASGLVHLDIVQQVSSVAETTTSGIDSPTIQQREIESSVAVQSGQTVVLGGLIRDRASNGHSGIPVLSDIPIIGNLFKTTSDTGDRTELLVLLTPRVVRNSQDARNLTEELRQRMPAIAPLEEKIHPLQPQPAPPPQ
jgi:general secretion pathway protein D